MRKLSGINFNYTCRLHLILVIRVYRSNRPEVFYKKGVLRNFTKFRGKHLYQGLFFNKVAGLKPVGLNGLVL